MGWIASVCIQDQHATLMDAAMRVCDAPTAAQQQSTPSRVSRSLSFKQLQINSDNSESRQRKKRVVRVRL